MADAGNTRRRARRIQVGANPLTINESLSRLDRDDYYRFVVGVRSSFDGRVFNIPKKSNFNFELQRNNGSIVKFSRNPARNPEDINVALDPGIYFLRVNRRIGQGKYRLQVSLNPDNAGDTFEAARNLGNVGQTPTSAQDFVGVSDPNDYYSFTVDTRVNFSLGLDQLADSADVSLFGGDRSPIATSSGSGTAPRSIQDILNPGTYYLRVFPGAGAKTKYNLTLSAAPVTDAGGNDFDTATPTNVGFIPRDVASDYVGVGDPSDFYSFSTDLKGDLQVDLTGLSDDLDIVLYNGARTELARQGGAGGNGNEQILASNLDPGLYYIQVVPAAAGISSTYNLKTLFTPSDQFGDGFADATLVTDPGTPPFPFLSSTPVTYKDFVGGADEDYFKLELNKEDRNFLSIDLTSLVGNLDLALFREGNGTPLLTSAASGNNPEILEGSLGKGVYYLRVYSGEAGVSSTYDLTMSLSSTSTNPTITRDVFPNGDALADKLTAVGNNLFFSARYGATGNQLPVGLWRSEGSLETTVRVGDFTDISSMVNLNGVLYFSANNGITGTELYRWEDNGTNLGVITPIADLAPGGLNSSPSFLTAAQNSLYFVATATGTVEGLKLYRVTNNGAPVAIDNGGNLPTRIIYSSSNDTLYYTASGARDVNSNNELVAGPSLWKITNASTVTPGTPAPILDTAGTPLDLTDDLRSVSNLSLIGNDLFFVAATAGKESNFELSRLSLNTGTLFTYDVNSDPNSGSISYQTDPADGTTPGFKVVVAQGYAYFSALGAEGEELHRANLTTNTTPELVDDLNPGGFSDSTPLNLTVFNNKVYFTAINGAGDRELFVTDPAGALTPTKFDILAGGDSSNPGELTLAGGVLYFAATGAQGRELWRYDGTNPPSQVININSGAADSNPQNLTVVGDLTGDGSGGKLYFTADDGRRGREVWTL